MGESTNRYYSIYIYIYLVTLALRSTSSQQMLHFRASARITAEEALRHEYFHHAGSESPDTSEGYHSPVASSRGDSPTLNSSADSGIQEA